MAFDGVEPFDGDYCGGESTRATREALEQQDLLIANAVVRLSGQCINRVIIGTGLTGLDDVEHDLEICLRN